MQGPSLRSSSTCWKISWFAQGQGGEGPGDAWRMAFFEVNSKHAENHNRYIWQVLVNQLDMHHFPWRIGSKKVNPFISGNGSSVIRGTDGEPPWFFLFIFRAPKCPNQVGCSTFFSWLVVWNIFYFPIYWEFHHPNWLSYFSEGWPWPTNQLVYCRADCIWWKVTVQICAVALTFMVIPSLNPPRWSSPIFITWLYHHFDRWYSL